MPQPKRPPTHHDRDVFEPKTPPKGVAAQLAAPEFITDEVTGQYDDPEELAAARARRPVPDRLAKLEQKHDEFRDAVDKRLNAVEVAVASVGGEMKVIPRLVDAMQEATKALQQREHVTLTAKVEVDKARELDKVAASADRRKLFVKAAGLFGSGGIVFELLHRLGVL